MADKININDVLLRLAFLGKYSEVGELLKHRKDEISLTHSSSVDGSTAIIQCVQGSREKTGDDIEDHKRTLRMLTDHKASVDAQDQTGKTALHWALLDQNVEMVRELVSLGADAIREDQEGHTVIQFAIKMESLQCLKFLIEEYPRKIVDRPNSHGTTGLIYAVRLGNHEACELLLNLDANPNAQEGKPPYRTALHYAIYNEKKDLFQLLLKRGARADIPDSHNKCVIHKAAHVGDISYLRSILSSKETTMSTIEIRNEDGATPLMLACQKEQEEQVKQLLDKKASVTRLDNTGKNVLHYCVENETTKIAALVLNVDKGLFETRDDEGYTPLQLAVIASNEPIIKFLLLMGANINTRDDEGHNVIHWATVCGHVHLIDLLQSEGAALSDPDAHNAYPLHYAAQMCGTSEKDTDPRVGLKTLNKILSKKVNVDCADQDQRTPLLWAASSGSHEACESLLKGGANVESADKDGLTALHCAASRGHSRVIDILVRKGALVDSTDKNGCTPLFYAVTLNHIDCCRVLLNRKAFASHRDNKGRSPSHCAAAKGSMDCLQQLIDKKGDLWAPNQRGEYPIHEASLAKQNDTVHWMLGRSKNKKQYADVVNQDERTCLHIAALTDNLPLCKTLLNHGATLNPLMLNKGVKLTPYDAAVLKEHKEVADYLRSKGGKEAVHAQEDLRVEDSSVDKKENNDEPERPEEEIIGGPPEDTKSEIENPDNNSEKGSVKPEDERSPADGPDKDTQKDKNIKNDAPDDEIKQTGQTPKEDQNDIDGEKTPETGPKSTVPVPVKTDPDSDEKGDTNSEKPNGQGKEKDNLVKDESLPNGTDTTSQGKTSNEQNTENGKDMIPADDPGKDTQNDKDIKSDENDTPDDEIKGSVSKQPVQTPEEDQNDMDGEQTPKTGPKSPVPVPIKTNPDSDKKGDNLPKDNHIEEANGKAEGLDNMVKDESPPNGKDTTSQGKTSNERNTENGKDVTPADDPDKETQKDKNIKNDTPDDEIKGSVSKQLGQTPKEHQNDMDGEQTPETGPKSTVPVPVKTDPDSDEKGDTNSEKPNGQGKEKDNLVEDKSPPNEKDTTSQGKTSNEQNTENGKDMIPADDQGKDTQKDKHIKTDENGTPDDEIKGSVSKQLGQTPEEHQNDIDGELTPETGPKSAVPVSIKTDPDSEKSATLPKNTNNEKPISNREEKDDLVTYESPPNGTDTTSQGKTSYEQNTENGKDVTPADKPGQNTQNDKDIKKDENDAPDDEIKGSVSKQPGQTPREDLNEMEGEQTPETGPKSPVPVPINTNPDSDEKSDNLPKDNHVRITNGDEVERDDMAKDKPRPNEKENTSQSNEQNTENVKDMKHADDQGKDTQKGKNIKTDENDTPDDEITSSVSKQPGQIPKEHQNDMDGEQTPGTGPKSTVPVPIKIDPDSDEKSDNLPENTNNNREENDDLVKDESPPNGTDTTSQGKTSYEQNTENGKDMTPADKPGQDTQKDKNIKTDENDILDDEIKGSGSKQPGQTPKENLNDIDDKQIAKTGPKSTVPVPIKTDPDSDQKSDNLPKDNHVKETNGKGEKEDNMVMDKSPTHENNDAVNDDAIIAAGKVSKARKNVAKKQPTSSKKNPSNAPQSKKESAKKLQKKMEGVPSDVKQSDKEENKNGDRQKEDRQNLPKVEDSEKESKERTVNNKSETSKEVAAGDDIHHKNTKVKNNKESAKPKNVTPQHKKSMTAGKKEGTPVQMSTNQIKPGSKEKQIKPQKNHTTKTNTNVEDPARNITGDDKHIKRDDHPGDIEHSQPIPKSENKIMSKNDLKAAHGRKQKKDVQGEKDNELTKTKASITKHEVRETKARQPIAGHHKKESSPQRGIQNKHSSSGKTDPKNRSPQRSIKATTKGRVSEERETVQDPGKGVPHAFKSSSKGGDKANKTTESHQNKSVETAVKTIQSDKVNVGSTTASTNPQGKNSETSSKKVKPITKNSQQINEPSNDGKGYGTEKATDGNVAKVESKSKIKKKENGNASTAQGPEAISHIKDVTPTHTVNQKSQPKTSKDSSTSKDNTEASKGTNQKLQNNHNSHISKSTKELKKSESNTFPPTMSDKQYASSPKKPDSFKAPSNKDSKKWALEKSDAKQSEIQIHQSKGIPSPSSITTEGKTPTNSFKTTQQVPKKEKKMPKWIDVDDEKASSKKPIKRQETNKSQGSKSKTWAESVSSCYTDMSDDDLTAMQRPFTTATGRETSPSILNEQSTHRNPPKTAAHGDRRSDTRMKMNNSKVPLFPLRRSKSQPIIKTKQQKEREERQHAIAQQEKEKTYGIRPDKQATEIRPVTRGRPRHKAKVVVRGKLQCQNYIQESVRIFEAKKLAIQQLHRSKKLQMNNLYKGGMSQKGLVKQLTGDYNSKTKPKSQPKERFTDVQTWEQYLYETLCQAKEDEQVLKKKKEVYYTAVEPFNPDARNSSYERPNSKETTPRTRDNSPIQSERGERKRRKREEEYKNKVRQSYRPMLPSETQQENAEQTKLKKNSGSQDTSSSERASMNGLTLPKLSPVVVQHTAKPKKSYSYTLPDRPNTDPTHPNKNVKPAPSSRNKSSDDQTLFTRTHRGGPQEDTSKRKHISVDILVLPSVGKGTALTGNEEEAKTLEFAEGNQEFYTEKFDGGVRPRYPLIYVAPNAYHEGREEIKQMRKQFFLRKLRDEKTFVQDTEPVASGETSNSNTARSRGQSSLSANTNTFPRIVSASSHIHNGYAGAII